MDVSISSVVVWVLIGLLATFGRGLDISLVLLFRLYKDWDVLRQLWDLHGNTAYLVHSLQVTISTFIFIQVLRFILNLSLKNLVVRENEFPVGPLLFPCRTDHSRLVPKKHTFSYSYFLVGVPIDWKGNDGGMISSGYSRELQPWYLKVLDSLSFGLGGTGAWWSVNADDYLGRGHDKDGLRGKLRMFLETQGINPDQYAHAYLLTAARFLGYASNPVSIWHLYSSDYKLKALVLEVNNTFDERHNYFLEPASTNTDVHAKRYTGTWPKDFYVSVFNSRTGAYSLSAIDPLAQLLQASKEVNDSKQAHIDSTITLSLPLPSTKPMLIARVFSSSPPLNPSTMSLLQKIRFLLTYSWIGFATFPRTVQQAWIILFNVKMPWVFTPQPRANTTPAKASPSQIVIEKLFREYIRHVVQQSRSAVRVKYIPAGIIGPGAEAEEMVENPGSSDFKCQELEIRVLTPLFYSRITQYSSIYDGLLLEEESGTISLTNPDELSSLDFTFSDPAPSNIFTNAFFSLLSHLKRDPLAIEPLTDEKAALYHANSSQEAEFQHKSAASESKAEWSAGGRRQERLSGLDAFVLASKSASVEASEESNRYAAIVLKLMLAERLGFGLMELLDLEILVLRVSVAWALVRLAT